MEEADESNEGPFNAFLRQAALEFVNARFENTEKAMIYICKLTAATFPAVTTLLRRAGFAESAALPELPNFCNKIGVMYFSIIASRPSLAKRAMKGHLVSTDVAIAVHRELDRSNQEIYVETQPISIHGQEHASLLLTTHLFPLNALQKICLTNRVRDHMCYFLEHGGRTAYNDVEHDLLAALLRGSLLEEDILESQLTVLQTWEEH
eukprot:6492256-Amphidinium_carterae.1